MTDQVTLVAIRRQIQQACALRGLDSTEIPRESVLIRDGHYCGRRFCYEQFEAIWFVEENQLKLHRADGELFATLDVSSEQDAATVRKAA